MNNKEALMEFGLNEKESRIYLFLLERGQSTAQEISKQTGILRQTVYELLRKLEHKGLLAEISINKKIYFEAETPSKLMSIIEEKKSIIKSILPDLNNLGKGMLSNSNAKLFRGLKGIRAINQEVLRSKEIRTILPTIGEESMKDFYVDNFSIKRIKKKIPIKILRGEVKTDFQKTINSNKKALRQVKFLKELSGINTQYIIYDNSVAIISFHQEPFGVVIEDEFIYNSMSIFFEIFWKQSHH